MNDGWMNRLSEYLDDELSPAERAEAETHLADCPTCAEALEELRRVRARARSLADAPAPEGIWEGIEARIEAGRTVPFPSQGAAERRGPGRVERGRGRISLSLPQLIAACLAVALVSGGAVYALLQGRTAVKGTAPGATTSASAPVTGPSTASAPENRAVEPERSAQEEPSRELVRNDERGGAGAAVLASSPPTASSPDSTPQETAIADLRKALARGRDRLDPATVRTLESNLAIIELAIDQGKRALAADPSNTYVKEHLADTMRRKVELLQRATVLASTSPEVSR